MNAVLSRWATWAFRGEPIRSLRLRARMELADRVQFANGWADLSEADQQLLLTAARNHRQPWTMPPPPDGVVVAV